MITIPCDTNACGYETEKLPRLHWHWEILKTGREDKEEEASKKVELGEERQD